MIPSSTYELVLNCPECVNLHTEFYKDPFWDRPYLMCTNDLPGTPDYCSLDSYVDYSKLHASNYHSQSKTSTVQLDK